MDERDKPRTQHIVTVTSEQPPPNRQGDDYVEYELQPTVTHYDNGHYRLASPQEEEIGIHGHFTLTHRSAEEPQQTETVHIMVYKPNYYRNIAGVIIIQSSQDKGYGDFMQGTILVDQTRLPEPKNFNLTYTRNELVHMALPSSGVFDIT